jgi:hypothetical protein
VARVILQGTLKWNGTVYPAGFAVDLPDDLLPTLPPGLVRPPDTAVPVYVPPPVEEPAPAAATSPEPRARQPFSPRIRVIQ